MSALELHPVIAPQPGRLALVARGVHWLRMPVAFAPGHVNLWAIEDIDGDGACWTLVDAGFPDAGTRANWSVALAGDLAGRPVRRILITHCHPDHFGLGEWLAQQTGARIWMSLGEYMTAQAWFGTVPATETGLMADFFLQHGLAPEQADVMRDEGGRYRRVVGEVPVAIRRILPGETLRIGGDNWTAIVGYGHSPEHLSFHRARDPVLIAGDMLLPRISPNTPTLAFEPEADAVGHYLDSIERFRLLAWSTLVLPAHGDPYRGVVARIDALQAHHAERLAQIVDLCAQPKTAAELLPALFRRELDSFQTRFAMGEVIAHLNHLWQAGRLRRLPVQDGVIRYTLPLPVSGRAIAMNKPAAKDATPTDVSALPDPAEVAKTYAQVAERASKLLGDHVQRQLKRGITPPADELGIAQAFMDMTSRLLSNPYKLAQAQMGLVWDYYTLWQQSMLKFMGVDAAPVVTPVKGDNRFRGEDWQNHFLFDFFKQSYLISARHIHDVVSNVEGMDEHTLQKVNFFTRQTINAFSPSNFAMTNPEVLRETVRSHGQNLLKGFNNLLRDIEDGDGQLRVRMTDTTAFELGRNVATTQGKVVGENALMQLLQFNPTTEQQFKRPLLIVPPWINKYYILDLRDSNSYIKWATDQGHTVFVISWVNPDEKLAQLTFEDYVEQGPLAAIDMITKQTGETEVNAVGYCLGGTLLAATLAYLSAKKDKRIASATFFTTLIDFAEPGELGVFIDEKAVEGLEKKMLSRGYLEGSEMAGTFNMLRSNDLIWSFVVNNYLMGREPFPFDLLYWNSDSTRMPACMHSYYLRQMYIHNKLREPGGITVLGEPIDIRKIKQPAYFISAIEDHIAPWKSTYTGATLLSGPTRFVLGGSGHIAGIVNPPAANKYGYWTNAAPKLAADADAWLKGSTQHTGSWWTDWQQWVTAFDADMVPARDPAKGKLKVIEDAPGRYVKLRLDTMKG